MTNPSKQPSIVRSNLLNIEGYTPYCGSTGHCPYPRTNFNGSQFVCKHCGWVSQFDEEFIQEYKLAWGVK